MQYWEHTHSKGVACHLNITEAAPPQPPVGAHPGKTSRASEKGSAGIQHAEGHESKHLSSLLPGGSCHSSVSRGCCFHKVKYVYNCLQNQEAWFSLMSAKGKQCDIISAEASGSWALRPLRGRWVAKLATNSQRKRMRTADSQPFKEQGGEWVSGLVGVRGLGTFLLTEAVGPLSPRPRTLCEGASNQISHILFSNKSMRQFSQTHDCLYSLG